MQTTSSMNWGRETSPRPCIPRNERNLPRIRSLLHVAPISQNDQPQRIERKLLAQTVRTDGQSLSHSRWVPRHLNKYKVHSFVPIAQQTVNSRANCRFRGIFVEQFDSIDLVLIKFNTSFVQRHLSWTFAWMDFSVARTSLQVSTERAMQRLRSELQLPSAWRRRLS